MRVSAIRRGLAVMLALIFCAASSGCVFCEESEYYDNEVVYGDVRTNPNASRANVQLHMDENPPYFLKPGSYRQKEVKITFRRDGDYWIIDDIPEGTILTVPEGYNARCVSFHTKAVRGTGKTLDNGRVIYPAGANVKYTHSSSLYLYTN